MFIRRKSRTEYYITPEDGTASIKITPDGSASLAVINRDLVKVHEREYKSRKGAMIALSRLFGHCEYATMVDSLETSERGFDDGDGSTEKGKREV